MLLGDNMFFVFRKDKIYAYLVSIFTVMFLFFVTSNLGSESKEVVETSTNTVNLVNVVNEMENNICK